MAFGNQWMNPAFYKNMNNEQVDWANLAQQWIKMKETTSALPAGQQGRSTICEPNILGSSQSVDSQNASNVLASNNTLGDHNFVGSITGNNVEKPSAWNSWTWQQQQQWNWNWASSSSSAPSTKSPIIESVHSVRQPYVAPPLLTEPPPSFPIISPNKQFATNNYWVGPKIPAPIESDQWNKNMLPNIDDSSQDSYIDAAKRKQLPAWIREGLEKMEREKRRKMEREQSFDEHENSSFHSENVSLELPHSPHSFDHETQIVDDETEHDSPDDDSEARTTEYVKNDPSPLIPRKTKAQIWEDTMLSLRQILTKLLMEVTNDMMLSVVKEVLKTTLQTDIQGNQSQTSLAGKLGLGVYGSESESSDESDEEQHASLKLSSKLNSDAAIQDRILKRQREFSNIEARILMELDQLEDREKLVRSKFDDSVKLSGDINDNGSQVVENIQTKGQNEDEGGVSQKIDKAPDKNKKELSNYLNIKNGQKKKKSKSKRSSSSSESSSSSSESKKSDDTDSKYSYRKNNKIKSKYLNKKHKPESFKRKRRSRSRNRSRSHSRSKRSRSRSRHRSNSRSRHNRRSPHSYKSRRSRTPVSRHGSSRKYKSKRNSSSSSNESRSSKHRYRR